MLYFYAPILIDETNSRTPGYLVDGTLTVFESVANQRIPVHDKVAGRFVVAIPTAIETPDGWTLKTLAEVQSDYPQVGG